MNTAVAQAQEVSLPSKPEPHHEQPRELLSWLTSGRELSFVYSRSMGGFMQTGRAVLSGMDSEYFELRSAGTTAIVVVRGAKYSIEPQMFFNPSLTSARAVPGVSVSLENFDWLFLTPARDEDLLVHGHVLPSA